MYLSRMHLLGFKSFPEKTELKFDKGITSIVGPNGCGKTNLLDALRWVLGETRMSVLRGSRLEEIIFAGTRDLKPLGMAEVSLTFDNHDRVIPSDYNEINVTRRLFRSGDSEFSINRTPCRLKDITEMILDTGLGPGAYSVIEQSMVDVLVSERTEDRRILFEEAAGITKYKQRKNAAIRKLDATESDLLRLQDVLSEVHSQVNMLNRQVSKAERHKTLSDEIKRIGMSLSSAEWNRLSESERELKKKLDGLRVDSDANSSRLSEMELKREQAMLEKTELDQLVRKLQLELSDAVSECHRLENQLSVLKEKKRNAGEQFQRASSDIDSLQRRNDSIDEDIASNVTEGDEVEKEIETLNGNLADAENDLDIKLTEFNRLKSELDQAEREFESIRDKLTGRRESQLSLDLRYRTDRDRYDKLAEELDSLDGRISELQFEYDERILAQRELERRIGQLEEELNSLQDSIAGRSGRIGDLEAEINSLRNQSEKASTRLEFVEKVVSEYEGYGSGAAALGRLKDEIPGLIDSLANLIQADSEHYELIQAVLGDFAGYFIVDSQDTADAVIERVKAERLGRVGLLVLDRFSHEQDIASDESTDHRSVRSLVTGADSIRPVLDFLFEGHFIAENDNAGFQPTEHYYWREDGTLFAEGGRIRSAGKDEVVLVGRKDEIQRLRKSCTELDRRRAELDAERVDEVETGESEKSKAAEVESELAVRKTELTELSIRNSRMEYELTSLNTQRAEKTSAREQIAGSLDSISRDKTDIERELGSLQAGREEQERKIAGVRERLSAAETLYNSTERECNKLRMDLVSVEGKLSTLRANGERLEEVKEDIERTIVARENQQAEATQTAVECSRSIEENEGVLKLEYEKADRLRDDLARKNSDVADDEAKIQQIDEGLKLLRKQNSQSVEQIHRIELDFSSVRSRKENLIEDALEHYEFDPSRSSLTVKLSEEQIEQMTEELTQKRARIANLGPVNMLALDEYEEQSKRYDFLNEQVEDLVKAKEDLKSTILKINTTAKRLFTETLEAVRTNFQDVFKELFVGGEADICLEDDTDPLESNIIITARPRGKKILSIQQLSGGERALTAISLLFSLYLVKPSPFCILDEVDAPLDDANIGRFLMMIRRFSENTQFIIITHNKLTMEAADILYGVTMRQPGVSQIVSVNLNSEADRKAILGESESGTRSESKSEVEEMVETEQ